MSVIWSLPCELCKIGFFRVTYTRMVRHVLKFISALKALHILNCEHSDLWSKSDIYKPVVKCKQLYQKQMEGQRYCWPALEWQGNLMIKNMEKAEVFGTVCSSAFTGTICFRALKACVSSGRVWRKDVLLKVYKAKVMVPLSKADINNSIGPGRTREAEEASSCQCYTALSSPNIHDNQLKSQKIGKRQMTCLSPKRERKRSQKITAL